MKRSVISKLLFVIFFITFMPGVSAQNTDKIHIKKINPAMVPKLEKKIIARLNRDRRLRNCAYLAGGSWVLYNTVAIIASLKRAYDYYTTPADQRPVQPQPQKKIALTDKAKQFGLGLGQIGLNVGGSLIVQSIMQSFFSSVIHDDSTVWAATQYAPIALPLRSLKTDAIEYAKPFRTDKERAYFRSMIQLSANKLVTNIQMLIAFISYKSKQLKINGTQPVTFLTEQTNSFVDRLLLAIQSDDHHAVVQAIVPFETLLSNELNRFAQLEELV